MDDQILDESNIFWTYLLTKAKPCPLSHTEQHKIRMPFLLARFPFGKRAGQQKQVDFLKWVKDDLPNSSATGFSTFNASWVVSNAMSHVSMISGAQMELNWGDD